MEKVKENIRVYLTEYQIQPSLSYNNVWLDLTEQVAINEKNRL